MNIIITGASRGIGYQLVKQFSNQNAYTIFALARDASKLKTLVNDCLTLNPKTKVISLAFDLNNSNELNNAIIEIKKHVNDISILINNAGSLVNKPFWQLTTEDFQKVYSTNVFSVAFFIQGLLPLLKQSNKAHVVNISSMGGFQGSVKFAGLAAYSSSKAALACLTECLAEEYKNSNIAFNCLALGAAQTEMLQQAFPNYKAPVSAAQMATFIADFSLNAHNYIKGKIIPVALSAP